MPRLAFYGVGVVNGLAFTGVVCQPQPQLHRLGAGMAPDAGGDSLHVGVNGGTPSTAANLTGFAPNQWNWSRLTMSNTNAILDLSSGGTYTLNVSMREDGLRLDRLMLVTDTATIPTGQGPLENPTTNALPPLSNQFITYAYDPLYRLTGAIYSGTFSSTYQYQYDALGNRKTYTATAVTTYQYDAANRLLQSDIQGGDTTIYDWDNASRLITTTVASAISRVYGYSQDGDLLSALVNGQTTTFLYDGNGNRLQMTVGSEVTTYTLDYGRGFQLLMEQGGAFATIKHYLYGLECIGELVDADIPATKEWRYYQRDGNSLVRQTTNEQEDITLAWAFSPEGAVVLGEEGPVTRLDCGSNAVYDWSTGLIFKGGRYFDPNTGIWLIFGGIVIWQAGWKRRFGRYGSKKRKFLLLLLYSLIALSLIGCVPNPTPTPCPTSMTPKTLPINVVLLSGTGSNLDQDINYANFVFSQAKVKITIDVQLTLETEESNRILAQDVYSSTLDIGLDNNTPLNNNPSVVYLTTEECLLVTGVDEYCGIGSTNDNRFEPIPTLGPNPHTSRMSNGNITVYYVPALQPSVTGAQAGGKYLSNLAYPNLPPGVIVGTNTSARTLPHELGHVFLGPNHPSGGKNFMVTTQNAKRDPATDLWYDEMTWDQIQIIRSSQYIR